MKLILFLIPFINGLSPSCINCKYDNYDSTSLSKCKYFETENTYMELEMMSNYVVRKVNVL